MKLYHITVGFVMFFSSTVIAQMTLNSKDKKAISEMMKAQEIYWNNGDIESFMEGYWNNAELVFVGKNGPTYGYHNTMEKYKKGYPDKESMGQLHFDILHTQQWDENTIQLIGKLQ